VKPVIELSVAMKTLVGVSFLFLLMTGCASRRPIQTSFFLQMADTQFGFFNENLDFKKETLNFEKAIAQANRLHPTFVIVCGDLVNKTGDTAQIAEYKRIASGLDPSIRLYNVPGNHDVGNVPTPSSLEKYRKNFGPDYYRFEVGHIVGLVLNSSLLKDPDSAQTEAMMQDRWLDEQLAGLKNATEKLVLIFQHHSYFLNDPEEKDQYFNFPLQKRRHYLELFKASGVKYIFAGHYHRNAGGRSGELEMITTGPIGRPLGSDQSGFRIVEINGHDVSHSYYSLDSIPKSISVH
jgi:serine/threonine-protein phosphatase CPPED1